jgi:AcrR family transcriptional regulator
VDLASEEGLEGVTIGCLAADMGLSKSGLFGHFGSKRELQLAAIDEASRRFVGEVVEPTLDEEEGEPRLRALCDRYVGYLEQRVFPGGCFFGAASTEFDGRPGPVRDRLRDVVSAWLTELERQAGIAGAPDPKLLAFELHAVAQAANSEFQLLDEEHVFGLARTAIERLLRSEIPR